MPREIAVISNRPVDVRGLAEAIGELLPEGRAMEFVAPGATLLLDQHGASVLTVGSSRVLEDDTDARALLAQPFPGGAYWTDVLVHADQEELGGRLAHLLAEGSDGRAAEKR